MEKNMSALRPSALSNRELVLACDNAWTSAGLPLDLQYEVYSRFCNSIPLDKPVVRDEKQLDLFM